MAAVLLAGCASTPPLPLDAAQQRAWVLQLADFSLAGRVAVATAGQGFNAAVDWRQQQDLAKVKLSGPLGAGSLQLEYSPAGLRVVTSRGDELVNDAAEQVLARELGFVPPFDALGYWIRGVPAPGAAAAVETRDAAGVLQTLSQQDWLIRYQRHVMVDAAAGSVQLPALLTATRGDLRLRLVIDRWRIR